MYKRLNKSFFHYWGFSAKLLSLFVFNLVLELRRQTSMKSNQNGSPLIPSAANPVNVLVMVNTSVIPGVSTVASNVTSTTVLFSASLALIPLKLDRENYTFWHSLILPFIWVFDLEEFLLGTKIYPVIFISLQAGEGSSTSTNKLQMGSLTSPRVAQRVNPKYLSWMRIDQALMSWLLSSISESTLGYVVHCTCLSQIWLTLQQLFTTTSKAWVLQLQF